MAWVAPAAGNFGERTVFAEDMSEEKFRTLLTWAVAARHNGQVEQAVSWAMQSWMTLDLQNSRGWPVKRMAQETT